MLGREIFMDTHAITLYHNNMLIIDNNVMNKFPPNNVPIDTLHKSFMEAFPVPPKEGKSDIDINLDNGMNHITRVRSLRD